MNSVVTIRPVLRRASAMLASVAVVASFASPAFARSSYVKDDAKLFSAATVSSLDSTIGDFNRQTGKEVVVVTVPSLDGATAASAAEKVFAQEQVNGVLVFLSKADKKQGIVPDRAAAAFFPPGEISTIRDAMRGYFRTGDFDTGVTTGVNLILDQYRSHVRAAGATRERRSPAYAQSFGGMSLLWLILILIAGFLIIRAVFRAIAGRRTMPPGYGGQGGYGGPGYGGGGPGYGGPGYGGGYGGGGGGGFFSGLLGGLGGAFIGNELFGRRDEGFGGNQAGFTGGDQGGGQDAGFQNDAGQADMGNASFGDYGSSGGGFGDGGGGGDLGGGGGGDSGGGW